MFVDNATLIRALEALHGKAGHLLKIWFVLKHMGLAEHSEPVVIDTSNATPSLKRLFGCGAPDGTYFVPFAHTKRYKTMKHDASRSIVQTNIQRWATSGSVVTCDPTSFLDFEAGADSPIRVSTGRSYPLGLGWGESGFALTEGVQVHIPLQAFAAWYGRQTEIPPDRSPAEFLCERVLEELHISPAEKAAIFVDQEMKISTRRTRLSDTEVFSIVESFIASDGAEVAEFVAEDYGHYARGIRGMVTGLGQPIWMRTSPEDEVKALLEQGAKAILLYGPPRTGKTRLIDKLIERSSKQRRTIQIHDGWGYDHLIEGLKPSDSGRWEWKAGPLREAITSAVKWIVLEEINRTAFSQALGEVFSLIEDSYRGKENSIVMRSGEDLWIAEDVTFLMTMNTVDKSTEEVDDALFGRVAAVACLPRAEDLNAILVTRSIDEDLRRKLSDLFAEIQGVYPLGHGYFAELPKGAKGTTLVRYYKSRIRPVLENFLGEIRQQDLGRIDNLVDEFFAAK